MRVSSIDIGTNTILLLVAEINRDGIGQIFHDEQVIARLGKGVDEHKINTQETFQRALKFLEQYRIVSDSLHSDKIVAVGTSALRDALNKNEFCSFIKEKTGIDIEIISGNEEAQWTYLGGISEFEGKSNNFSVIDIGGGSTEIIFGDKFNIHSKVSLNIGCVRLTERFLHSSPPTEVEIQQAQDFIREQFAIISLPNLGRSFSVGVAGTVTTLASLHQQLPMYDPKKVSGYLLTLDAIQEMYNQLRTKSVEEIKRLPQVSEGRADILLAGVLILIEYINAARLQTIAVSDRGLRYGILLREIEKMN